MVRSSSFPWHPLISRVPSGSVLRSQVDNAQPHSGQGHLDSIPRMSYPHLSHRHGARSNRRAWEYNFNNIAEATSITRMSIISAIQYTSIRTDDVFAGCAADMKLCQNGYLELKLSAVSQRRGQPVLTLRHHMLLLNCLCNSSRGMETIVTSSGNFKDSH